MPEYEKAKAVAGEIAAIKIESLLRMDLPAELNFSEFQPKFERIQKFFTLIANARLELIPFADSVFHREVDAFVRIKTTLENIAKTNLIREQNPQSSRNSMIQHLEGTMRSLFQEVGPHLMYALLADERMLQQERDFQQRIATQFSDVENYKASFVSLMSKEVDKLKGHGEEVIREMKSRSEAAESVRKQIEEIAQSARTAAQITGISAQSEHFKELADEYAASAKNSLRWAMITGVLLLIFAAGFYLFEKPTVGSGELVQKLVARVVFISVGFTAFIVCFRNYGAAKHNYTVNRHKATTLKTFEVFINGSANPEVKEAILLQAAKSAFEPQSTGFLRTEGDGPQISQITELVKATK